MPYLPAHNDHLFRALNRTLDVSGATAGLDARLFAGDVEGAVPFRNLELGKGIQRRRVLDVARAYLETGYR
jgi:hypothetical protein